MSKRSDPQITSNARKEEYTRITFVPDLEKFGMTCIDDDTEALLKKRVYDLCGAVKDVKVYLNDERLKIKNFRQYIDLYLNSSKPTELLLSNQKPAVVHEIVNDRWEIAYTLSDGQFQQVSFVNSISTTKGGTHVNYIADQIAAKLVDAVSKKNKAAPIKPFQIKNHMWLFVNCLVENPTFDSQTKEHMTLKTSAFGSKCPVSDEFLNKVKKSGLVENVLSWAKFKQDQLLKKTDGAKRSRITGISKLDDANNAGTRNAQNCTLILTEGDSAKTLAVTGLGVIGRDNYGVFPLRGKLLNVREASHKQIMENQEINHVKQIMGLQHGKKYTDASSLRYGHLMIMTDQDHDGSHIKGLIINFLDHFWPDLLKVPGFLCEFITPIVKVTKGGETGRRRQELSFFTIPEYEAWKEANNNGKGWTIKYYKGLGTSTKEDAKKYFSDIPHHKKPFAALESGDRDLIDMAFNKKKTDNRKEWLRQYQPGTFMDHDVDQIRMSDFINRELILFSMADNIRSIPCAVDGLKPGLRKIVFACFKRNLVKGEIKVAQLSGYIAEHSAYHHGEQSLQSSIVGLAQNFVGSNNVNLLEPRGQFGSRLQGGKDAASARYIFTRLSPLARKIFPKADDALLAYLNDDGQSIEPEWYIPILPLLLVNGGEGIGTGWSSFIPNYNPREICENLKRMMSNEELLKMHPWYRGFKGTITEAGSDKYTVSGIIRKTNSTTLEITELPIRTWTQSYKEFLETLVNGTEKTPAFIKEYKEYHTDSSVHFIVTLSESNMAKAEEEGLDKKFKITTSISTSNMVCFDQEGRIRKFNSPEEIIKDFYHLRLQYYQKRKEHMVNQLTQEYEKLDNKVRFIQDIIGGKLTVHNRRKAELLRELVVREFRAFPKNDAKKDDTVNNDDESEEDEEVANAPEGSPTKLAAQLDKGYDYLLSMPLWNLTREKVDNLKAERDQKQKELDTLLGTSVRELWCRDLDEFMEEWDAFEHEMNDAEEKAALKALPKGSKGAKAAAKKFKFSKKMMSDDETESEDDIMDDISDEEYDFKPKAKKASAAVKAPREPAKPKAAQPAKKAPSKSALQQSSITSFMKKSESTSSVSSIKPFTSVMTIDDEDDEDDMPVLSFSQALAKKKQEKRHASPPPTVPSPKKTKSPTMQVLSDEIGTKLVIKPKASKSSKKETIQISSDDDSDDRFAVTSQKTKKPAAVTKSTATAASKSAKTQKKTPAAPKLTAKKATKSKARADSESEPSAISDSDSDMEDLPEIIPKKPAARSARAAITTKKVAYVESDDDETASESNEVSYQSEEESDDYSD